MMLASLPLKPMGTSLAIGAIDGDMAGDGAGAGDVRPSNADPDGAPSPAMSPSMAPMAKAVPRGFSGKDANLMSR